MAEETPDAKTLVKKFFHDKNRPFGANEVILSLQKQVSTKSHIQKSIDALVEEGTLKEKVYNKQKVYVYNQALFPEVQKSQIKELDLRINDAKIKLQEIQHKVKQKSAELSKLSSLPTLEKAKEDYEELCRKETELKEKIDKIKESAGAIEPEVRQAILKDHELYSKEVRKRKRWCNDLLDMILEGYPSSKDQLMEEIGIEPF